MILEGSIIDGFADDNGLLDNADTIFHYTSRSKAFEEILFRSRLQPGTFGTTDDPQEYNEKFASVSGSTREGVDAAVQVKWELDDILLRQTGFLSFCLNHTRNKRIIDAGYLKSRMWSQYGDHHRGVCLALSRKSLMQVVRSINKRTAFTVYSGRIVYRDFDPYIDKRFLEETRSIRRNENSRAAALEYLDRNWRDLCFRKQKDYRDESEYRVAVVKKSADKREFEPIPLNKCLKAVILGDKIPAMYRKLASKLKEDLDVPYFELKWDSGTYMMYRLRA